MADAETLAHPSLHARAVPGKQAVILSPAGMSLSYADLEAHSNQGAHLFRSLGLRAGDTIAICLENSAAFFEVAWAAQRSGLYYVCLSTKLQVDELEYILADSGTKVLITSAAVGEAPAALAERPAAYARFVVGAPIAGYRDYLAERGAMPQSPISDEQAGFDMLYSSGTTGRPKGIKPRPVVGEPITTPDGVSQLARQLYGASADTVYLCPAPLYHAAPLRWCMAMMRLGATVVVMERFDPEAALKAIEQHHVTIAQFVPTHFVRMLKMAPETRAAYDLSSLKVVIHAAAPCPVPVKEAMLEWLGPIVHEYYSGSEGNGGTFIGPQEWLSHKGSVGRPLTTKLHICDESGQELPPGMEGLVYFSGGSGFEYHNDPDKTRETRNNQGWSTLGDVGRVDEDGYLYLTDRKSFMIISGGVNIYPQEIENLLVTHPKVTDVAVIGAPDEEMGEKVVAVVQPADLGEAGPELAAELIAFARARLSHVKAPRQVDFRSELPRHQTGKLYKRLIRDEYWADTKAGLGSASASVPSPLLAPQ